MNSRLIVLWMEVLNDDRLNLTRRVVDLSLIVTSIYPTT